MEYFANKDIESSPASPIIIESSPHEFTISHQDKNIICPIPSGYGPPGGGRLLASNLGDVYGKTLCDLGTGFYALNPLMANLLGAKFSLGVEIQSDRCRWAEKIIKDNHLQNITIANSDTIPDNIGVGFDIIVGNLPMMPSPHSRESTEQIANIGGYTGWEIIDSYLAKINQYLNHGGSLRLLILDYLGIDQRTSRKIPCAFERLRGAGLQPTIIASEEKYFSDKHPFIQDPILMKHLKLVYPRYPFDKLTYNKFIVEGRNS